MMSENEQQISFLCASTQREQVQHLLALRARVAIIHEHQQ
jgi:hypothetical protein